MVIMSRKSKTNFFLLIMVMMTASYAGGARAGMTEKAIELPKTAGAWTRPDAAKIIDSSTIFKYMNGGGELYLAYGFSRIEIYEYTAGQKENILVEVYVMDTESDAFGLLSLDWGGEKVPMASQAPAGASAAPRDRAMYGGGLLRMATGRLFVRVMAYQETPESRKAVLSLGRALAENRHPSAEPGLLKHLPQTIDSAWRLRNDRVGYFRSHLVLNSLYYLSHQNILGLDLSCEAVTAPYELLSDGGSRKRVQFLLVNYASPEKARQALYKFHEAYLPDHKNVSAAGASTAHSDFFQIEDGWVGYRLDGPWLAVVFECADRASARMILNAISFGPIQKGDNYEK